ncbi:hypothetical protein QTO30_13210 [Yoonia sp. GPGPB17]|uniref:hypothetical protein n=1 Tax=Yoonia sp. GPGPB17 TaxID=3026147 RepID=UPI0030C49379
MPDFGVVVLITVGSFFFTQVLSVDYLTQRLQIANAGAIEGASFPGIDYDTPHHIMVFDVKVIALFNPPDFAVVAPGVPNGFRVDHEGFIWASAIDDVSGRTAFITSSDKIHLVESKRRDASHVLKGTGRNPL